jgi:organic radical activating enzyme
MSTQLDYELIITYKCNWNCSYCCVDTHNRPEPINIFENINKIPNGSMITISGGEPGLLQKNKIIEILDKLLEKKCDIGINTNGLFLEKYPDLIEKYFTNINYHVSPELDINDDIVKLETSFKINYLLIVTDINFKNLDNYLAKYPDIIFTIIPASNPGSGILGAPELNMKNRFRILKKYYKRITQESKKVLLKDKVFDNIIYLRGLE